MPKYVHIYIHVYQVKLVRAEVLLQNTDDMLLATEPRGLPFLGVFLLKILNPLPPPPSKLSKTIIMLCVYDKGLFDL